MKRDDRQALINIYNTSMDVEVKGSNAVKMGVALTSLQQLINRVNQDKNQTQEESQKDAERYEIEV